MGRGSRLYGFPPIVVKVWLPIYAMHRSARLPNRALYVNDRIFVCKSGQCVDVAIGVVSGEIAVVEP